MKYIDLGEARRIYQNESMFYGSKQTSLAFTIIKRIPTIKNSCSILVLANVKKLK